MIESFYHKCLLDSYLILMKSIYYLLKRIVYSLCLLYTINVIIYTFGIIIPINIYSIVFVSIFDVFGVLVIVFLMFYN